MHFSCPGSLDPLQASQVPDVPQSPEATAVLQFRTDEGLVQVHHEFWLPAESRAENVEGDAVS